MILTGDSCRIGCRFDGDADSPVLVLAHSLGARLAMWEPQMAVLSQHFRVLRYDLRGHGSSDVPEGSYSLDSLGRDVIELLDAYGLAHVHFCGLSLGGMIGQWLGYRAPERLLSLTLANTSAYMGPPSSWDDRIAAVKKGGMATVRDAVLARWFSPDFKDTAPVAAMLDATDPLGYAGCCAAIRDMDMRLTNRSISVPTLVIGGLRDPATPPNDAKALHDAIQGSKLVMLDAAHLSNIECSNDFTAALHAHLDAQGDQI